MHRRRPRTNPTVTELSRVEQVLERDPGLRARLGPKTSLARKRTGEVSYFAAETVAVAEGLMDRGLSPERARVRVVLAVAVKVLGVTGAKDQRPESG